MVDQYTMKELCYEEIHRLKHIKDPGWTIIRDYINMLQKKHESELKIFNKKLSKKSDKLKVKTTDKRNAVKTIEDKLSKSNSKISELLAQLKQKTDKVLSHNAEINGMKLKMSDLNKQMVSLKKEKITLKNSIDEIDCNKNATKELSKMKDEKFEVEQELKKLQDDVRSKDVQITRLTNIDKDVTILKQDLGRTKDSNRSLRLEFEKRKDLVQKLNDEIVVLTVYKDRCEKTPWSWVKGIFQKGKRDDKGI